MNTNIKSIASEEVVTAINGKKVNEFNLQQVLDDEIEFRDIVDKMAFLLVCMDKNKERMDAIKYEDLNHPEVISAEFFGLSTEERILKALIKCVKEINKEYAELKAQRELTQEEKEKMYGFINSLTFFNKELKNRQDRINCWVDTYTTTFKFENK